MSRIGSFIVTTISEPVNLPDLGIELIHPSTSDLFDEFDEYELNNSADLQSAIASGLLTSPAITVPNNYIGEKREEQNPSGKKYFDWHLYRSSLKNSYKPLKALGGDSDDYPLIIPANCVLWQIKSNLEPVWLRLFKNFGLYKEFLLTDWPHQNISFEENDVVYVFGKKLNNTENIWFQGSSSSSSSNNNNNTSKCTVNFYFKTE